MILQALHDYYQRKIADPDPARRLPAFGLEEKEIPFVLELTRGGELAAIKDTRIVDGKRKVGARYLVPMGFKKASGIAANLLWDNAEYVLGLPDAKKLADARVRGKAHEYEARLAMMHDEFKARLAALPREAQTDEGLRAVLAFLAADPRESVARYGAGVEIAEINPNLSFRLVDDVELVCQRSAVMAACAGVADAGNGSRETADGVCLITGMRGEAERLHRPIKGVWGAQTSGANIVSFNLDAFDSLGKSQGANAPVSPAAAFAYTTALNYLLSRGSRQRVQVGDASTVFWAQRAGDADVEDLLAQIFGDADDPDARTARVRALFESINSGRFAGTGGDGLFYVLGLAPNAARIAVRFWHAARLADIAQRIRDWFDDLRIARGPNDPEYPSLFRLLKAVAVQGKSDNIPPNLGGDIMRSILSGGPFPAAWLNAAIQRGRAEQKVTYLRAAAIRACLNRSIRHSKTSEKEMTEVLDKSNPDYPRGSASEPVGRQTDIA